MSVRKVRSIFTKTIADSNSTSHATKLSATTGPRGRNRINSCLSPLGKTDANSNFNAFEAILVPFSTVWDSSTITQSDVNPYGQPQPHRRSLDSA
ncbi:uncharacterized protein VP01_1725g4, partial [Puccinia sorghi]